MGIKFANNASTNITNALTADATSVSVTPGTGNLFPSIVEGKDYFYATLAGNNGLEIVKVTKRVLDTMTLERAQDGTSALVFNQGDLFELRIVAAAFEDTFSNVDTTLEDTIDYLNSSIADLNTSVDNKMSSYLPLSGGTMTGILDIAPAAGSREGGELHIIGPEGHPQRVVLDVNTGTNLRIFGYDKNGNTLSSHILQYNPETGSFSIGGNNIITSAGGTLFGSIRMGHPIFGSRTDGTGYLEVHGGSADNDGAFLQLNGASRSDWQEGRGRWSLIAADGSGGESRLYGTPEGGLYFNNNSVLTSAGGTITGPISAANQYALTTSTDSDALIMTAGTGWDAGGRVICHGKDHPSNPGKASVVGVKDNKFIELTLDPEGLVSVNGSSPRFNTAFMPAGMVIAYAGQDLPPGCLLCNGAAVSRTTYAALFSAIGTIYGAGDGSTTFNLPNLEERFIQGRWQSGHYIEAGLPDHTHLYESTQSYYYGSHGYNCLYTVNFRSDGTSGTQYPNWARDRLGWASAVNGFYGRSGTVQPPALTMRYCIKY